MPSFALEHLTKKREAFEPGVWDRLNSAVTAGDFLEQKANCAGSPLLVDWIELFLCVRLIQGREYASTWRRLESLADADKFAAFMRAAAVGLAYVYISQSNDHAHDVRRRGVLNLSGATVAMFGSEERGIVCDLAIAAFGRSLDRKRVRAICRGALPESNSLAYSPDDLL